MTHDEIRNLVTSARDQELPASQRSEVAGHLETCAECALESRLWDRISERVLARPLPAASESFVASVMARVEPSMERRRFWSWKLWWIPTLGLTLATSFVALNWPDPSSPLSADAVLLADRNPALMNQEAVDPVPEKPGISDVLRDDV